MYGPVLVVIGGYCRLPGSRWAHTHPLILRRPMHALVLASITQTLTSWVAHHGAYAIFVIMAIDAVFPAAGELTMLVAGAVAGGALAGDHPILLGHVLSTGAESYVVLSLSGTLGYLFGALVGWAIGRWGGRPLLERHGRWLHLGPENLDRAERWFDRHGRAAVFLGRLTPVVRSFTSIPAGALESPLAVYTVLTLAGSAIWCFAFAGAGWALGRSYDEVHHAFTGIEIAVVVIVVLGIAALIVRGRRRRARRA
jgi:membrane protein DedA with SNARE-associated domain